MGLRTKTILIGALVLLLFAFPPKAYAAEKGCVSILCFDEKGRNYWHEEWIELDGGMTPAEQGQALFQTLFQHEYENAYRFPADIEIFSVTIENGCFILDVSREITAYGGGSYLESALKSQIIKTALDIDGIDKVTLLIDHGSDTLPEGSIMKEVTQWPEMTEEETTN